MTFDQIWNSLIKRWKLIVICFMVVGLGAYIGSKLTTPLFQSTALVQVTISSNNHQADINSLLASDQLVQTEARLTTSYPVLHEVASHHPGLTADQLAKNVTATPTANTQLFQIDVSDPSPTRAADLANDIARVLIEQQTQVAQQDNTQSQQQIQQDLQQTQKQINTITRQIVSLQAKNANDARISDLTAQVNTLQLHYTQWQSLLGGSFLHIAQSAQPALSHSRPNVLLNTAVGFLVGLLNGLLLALLLEQLDTRVRTEEALTALVDLPVLATVWRPDSSKNKKNQLKNEELVNPQQHNANVESYRILRTNIGFSMIDKPLHTIMVTSATPHDGKSTTAANLAIFMAKAGKKTLLIDADMRRPTIGAKFHLPKDVMGLSNAIIACSQLQFAASTLSMSQSNQPLPTNFSLDPFTYTVDIPNLRIMPSGTLVPNPPELLDSKAMERFFIALASWGAEMIILDTAPLLGLSDASILAHKVDGVLVVVDVTSANKKNLIQMKAKLAQSGSRILGCVVNKQHLSRKDTSYYYYSAEEENQSKSVQNEYVPASPVTMARPDQR